MTFFIERAPTKWILKEYFSMFPFSLRHICTEKILLKHYEGTNSLKIVYIHCSTNFCFVINRRLRVFSMHLYFNIMRAYASTTVFCSFSILSAQQIKRNSVTWNFQIGRFRFARANSLRFSQKRFWHYIIIKTITNERKKSKREKIVSRNDAKLLLLLCYALYVFYCVYEYERDVFIVIGTHCQLPRNWYRAHSTA